jgi:regulator of protease activity HflC (stomatin/prohibitin superfamily)
MKGLILAASMALTGCYVIDAGEVGVVSTFGDVSNNTLTSGLHLVAPWRSVEAYSTQIGEYTMSAVVQEGENKRDDSMKVLSADGLEVQLDATVIYRIDPTKVVTIYRELGDAEALKVKVIRPVSRTRIRDAAVSYAAVELYGAKREVFEKTVFDSIAKDFAARGLILEQILIRDMKLPDSVKHSIEDKIAAEQAAQKMQYVLEKAKQEAEQKRIEAQGVADAQKILDSGLSERVLRYEQIKMQSHLAHSQNAKVIVIPQGQSILLNQ